MTTNIVSDFTFNKMTNINDDNCAINQINRENAQASNYMVQNYYPSCPMTKAIDFALQQPNLFYNGSHQVGINGCNIQDNSKLKYTPISKPPCKIIFSTTIYNSSIFRKGPQNVNLESQLRDGELIYNSKSTNPSSEVSYINYKIIL